MGGGGCLLILLFFFTRKKLLYKSSRKKWGMAGTNLFKEVIKFYGFWNRRSYLKLRNNFNTYFFCWLNLLKWNWRVNSILVMYSSPTWFSRLTDCILLSYSVFEINQDFLGLDKNTWTVTFFSSYLLWDSCW